MSSSTTQKAGNYLTSMIIIGVLFFIFGFVTWLNGTLIPFLKLACELKTDTQAFFVTSAFYMAYFFLAIPSSGILQRTGFKNGMALGLLVMALGSLIFIPAANTRNFALFLTGLFVQGAGLSLLQTASNPYISIIGPIESAAQRISFMGICNKIAGALSPLILGAIVLKNASKLEQDVLAATSEVQKAALLDELAQRVIMPYTIMAIILVILAFWIRRSALPDVNMEADLEGDDKVATNKTSVFQFPHLLLGALCIFMYVGAEVMAGDVIGTYGKNLGFSLDQAKYFTSFTLISMLLGYIIGIMAIPKYITQESSLKYAAILGVIFTIAAFLTKGQTSVTFIALLGLANAPMWPAIFPLGINKLGKFTKIGSALMIMGIAGGAIIPLVYGEISKSLGFQMAFMVTMLPCYLYVLYYAVAGYRTK
ncbi:MAG: sugar MFS transporter [Haliscomenobacter sp.]|nr:sugar MFS transporter [Haliscomenobacter sp.]MBK9489282.1 sugar MFS transporter [Haliscomenobacter sp.]